MLSVVWNYTLIFGKKPTLIIMYDFFNVLLNSASNYLTEKLGVCVHHGNWFLSFFGCVLIQFAYYILTRFIQ